jgi:hypothetical protein
LKKNIAKGSTFAFELETHKNLGQHFLNHAPTIQKIAELTKEFDTEAGSRPAAGVLEIGPGSGALTLALLALGHKKPSKKTPAQQVNLRPWLKNTPHSLSCATKTS